jgi:hypothetical protein
VVWPWIFCAILLRTYLPAIKAPKQHTAYAHLPLDDAQLDVDADAEAGCYQCMNPAQQSLVHCLPSNHALLHISGNVTLNELK